MRNIILMVGFTLFLGTIFWACKSESKQQKLLEGRWQITVWNNQPNQGSFVFGDSTVEFELGGVTEKAVYYLKNDTLSFRRTGGNTNMISSGNDWVVDSLSENILGLYSHYGLILRAIKVSE